MDSNKAIERATAISAALRCCGSRPKAERCKAECVFYQGGYLAKCIPAMTEAAATLIEQLTAEPPNKPLTLEELRGMDWEPLYIRGHNRNGYYIASDVESGLDLYRGGCGYEGYRDYGKTWLAYRRKPDGGGE